MVKRSAFGRDFGPDIRRSIGTLPPLPSEKHASRRDPTDDEVTYRALLDMRGHGPASARMLAKARRQLQDEGRTLDERRAEAARVDVDPRKLLNKEFRADPVIPDGPLVRGSRVRDPLRRMFNSGDLSKRQWDAIELFRDDVHLANGAKVDQPDTAGIRSAPTNRNWPADEQLSAMRRVARTWDELADEERPIINWMVIEHRTLDDYASHSRIRRQTVTDHLRAGLKVLARRYRNLETSRHRGVVPAKGSST